MARGAGGPEGGLARFGIGLAMIIGGGYLFFDSIRVTSGFRWGMGMYHLGGFGITSGMILIPLIFGIGFLFYNAKNPAGHILFFGSLLALAFGVIRSIHFNLAPMSFFDLGVILVLLFGGIGLMFSSFKDLSKEEEEKES